jgi:hypothetical protein
LLVAAPAAAQLSARADLSVDGRYVWHGISRAAGVLGQPSLAVGLQLRSVSMEGGAVFHYELDAADPGELSEIGVGEQQLGEENFWGRASLDIGSLRLQSGVVRYVFHGDPTQGGLGSDRNTTEVYAALSKSGKYLHPSLQAWWDVERGGGAFVDASTYLAGLGWPFPQYAFVYAEGDVGLSLGHADFSGDGITHVGLGLGTQVAVTRTLTFGAGVRSQLNLDDATTVNGATQRRDFNAWLWTGFTVALGGAARGQR